MPLDFLDCLRAYIEAERAIDRARGMARFSIGMVRAIVRASSFRTTEGEPVYVAIVSSGEIISWTGPARR